MLKQGQWIQIRTEPDLGPAKIIDILGKSIKLYFPIQKETRVYSHESSTLDHLQFGTGSLVYKGSSKTPLTIQAKARKEISESFFEYKVNEEWVSEVELTPISVHIDIENNPAFWPEEWGESSKFNLRLDAWELLSRSLASPVAGLVGAKIEPMPHQLYLATTLTKRPNPRAILADEVGLGKTIEAGLIYSRLKSIDKASRVLILCPESLLSQWLVEMSHRFGDWFTVLDEDYLAAISEQTGTDPFLSTQRGILPYSLLEESPEIAEQIAQTCQWDLVIADEAHHLDWYTSQTNPLWNCAKKISEISHSLLLLTATPRNHGLETLFGLLHLINPDQYDDFEAFEKEEAIGEQVAQAAKELKSGNLSTERRKALAELFAHDKAFSAKLLQSSDSDEDSLLTDLMDRHTTGFALVRNRREVIKGFSERVLHSVPLKPSQDYINHLQTIDPSSLSGVQLMDYATGRGHPRSFVHQIDSHPKFKWLSEFIAKNRHKKILVICAQTQLAFEASKFLLKENHTPTLRKQDVALFHDGLTFIERDQQAASFARRDGAQILLCSQVGGEGRNFQFADTIIFLDLPKLPDEVEQRIGRLDRIGQKKTVHIYVPWLESTPEEVLFNWFNQGIGNFSTSTIGADPLLEQVAEELLEAMQTFFPCHDQFSNRKQILKNLIATTSSLSDQYRKQQARSVDILLDAISNDPKQAQELAEEIDEIDDDPRTENLIHQTFESFGLDPEDLDGRGTFKVPTADDMPKFVEYIPGMEPGKDLVFTFDRQVAIKNEHVQFVSFESPLMISCLEYLTSPYNSHFSIGKISGITGLNLELLFVLKVAGPKHLGLDKFLPLQTLKICLDHHGKVLDQKIYQKLSRRLETVPPEEVHFSPIDAKQHLLPVILKGIKSMEKWQQDFISKACNSAKEQILPEIKKSKYLTSINPHFDPNVATDLENKLQQTLDHLNLSQPRLDSVRLWIPG